MPASSTRRSSRSSSLIFIVFNCCVLSAAFMVWMERKVCAYIQDRYGPNRVGPEALLQPFADVMKLIFKEELRPKAADALLFTLAPILSAAAAFAAFSVVPFGTETTFFGLLDRADPPRGRRRQRRPPRDLRDHVDGRLRHRAGRMELQQQVLAARRPALVGADDQLRAVVRPVVRRGDHARRLAVAARDRRSTSRATGSACHSASWYVFLQPLGFLIFMTAGVAETNRAPFDFPEAEQELVAGYHTEYSCMSFALFFLAEYVNMVTVSAVATSLFLGGWLGPFLPDVAGWIWFLVKVFASAVLLRLDALDAAALSLRPADGVRLEVAAAGRGGQPDRDRGAGRIWLGLTMDADHLLHLRRDRGLASLLVVGQRNPMYSVLLLIVSFGALAGLYVLLDAPFIAVTQIIIYAGAIMVLFLFVVMLLNVPTRGRRGRSRRCSAARAMRVRRACCRWCWPSSSPGRCRVSASPFAGAPGTARRSAPSRASACALHRRRVRVRGDVGADPGRDGRRDRARAEGTA